MKPNDTVTTVYRFFDQYDRLLYVGISIQPLNRLGQHQSSKSWWTQIVRVEMVHYADRATAKAVETKAIQDERPLYNIQEDQRDEAERDFVQSFIGLLWHLEPRLHELEIDLIEGGWVEWDEDLIASLVGWRRQGGERTGELQVLAASLEQAIDSLESVYDTNLPPAEQLLQSRLAYDAVRDYLTRTIRLREMQKEREDYYNDDIQSEPMSDAELAEFMEQVLPQGWRS